MPASLRRAAACAGALSVLALASRGAHANDTFPIQLVAGSTVSAEVANAGQTDTVSTLPVRSDISPTATVPGNQSDTAYDLSEEAFAFTFTLAGVPDFAHNAAGNDDSSATLNFIAHADVGYQLTHEYLPGGIVPMTDNVQLVIDLVDDTGQPLTLYHLLANDLQPPFESGSTIGGLQAEHVYQLAYHTYVKAALGGSHHVTDSGNVTLQISYVPEPVTEAPTALAALAALAGCSSRRRRRRY